MRDDRPPAAPHLRLTERVALAAEARDSAPSGRAIRRERGVVHTPPELARWAARRLDTLLREELALVHGLADPAVGLLDPSVGPGIWLAAALEQAARAPTAPCACLGLDLDADAVAVAQALLGPPARASGWPLSLRVENTLAVESPWPAGRVPPVVVVLGNPPWAGRSQNRDVEPTSSWLADFRRDHAGAPLAERRIGVLSDDYVRFLRWSAEQARRGTAGGVVCLATNASFLDGPVHRGVRAALVRWFDGVEVLDLGGSALLARPDQADENLFGVRPSAALTVAWTRPRPSRTPGRARYGRLWGTRQAKLARLDCDAVGPLSDLPLAPPAVRLAPGGADTYPLGAVSLAEAMPFHREGVQTNRDALATGPTREALLEALRAFLRGDLEVPARRHFSLEAARRAVEAAFEEDPEGTRGRLCVPLAYRPWESRWLTPIAPLCHRPRPDLARAAAASPFCLVSARKDRGDRPWHLFGAVSSLVDGCFLSTRSSCRTRAFPLRGPDGEDNLAPAVAAAWSDALGAAVEAQGFAHYALCVMASARYRTDHGEALLCDYPRIPRPASAEVWRRRVVAGRGVALALTVPPSGPVGGLSTGGEWPVRDTVRVRYDAGKYRVWLGESAYLDGVEPADWAAEVGHFRALARRLGVMPLSAAQALEVVAGVRRLRRALAEADLAYLDT